MQQKFYSLPKRYKRIRRFEQRLFVGRISDQYLGIRKTSILVTIANARFQLNNVNFMFYLLLHGGYCEGFYRILMVKITLKKF